MAKSTAEILKQAEAQPMGAIEAALEGIKAIAPGLALSKILGDIGEELGHLGPQGAHELAASLYTGSSFVMYPHAGQESVEQGHGLPTEAQAIEPMQQESERGGIEM